MPRRPSRRTLLDQRSPSSVLKASTHSCGSCGSAVRRFAPPRTRRDPRPYPKACRLNFRVDGSAADFSNETDHFISERCLPDELHGVEGGGRLFVFAVLGPNSDEFGYGKGEARAQATKVSAPRTLWRWLRVGRFCSMFSYAGPFSDRDLHLV